MKDIHKGTTYQRYTQGDYLSKNPTWHIEDSPWKAQQILKIIQKNNIQPNSICEIGCGAGEILNQLHSQMPETVRFDGYEISPQAFALCQEREKDRLQFHNNDLLEDENAFFDILLCIDVFEHVDDYLGFVKKIRNRARYKIFHIPLDLNVYNVVRNKLMEKREVVGHLHYFTQQTGLATLGDSGYEIVDWFYTGVEIEIPYQLSTGQKLLKAVRQTLYSLNQNLTVQLLGGYSLLVLAT